MITTRQTQPLLLGIVLLGFSSAANAVSINLYGLEHYITGNDGSIIQQITDGSHASNIAGATTASWNWDGTTLNGSGLFSSVASIHSGAGGAIFADQIMDLSFNTLTGATSASSFSCIEDRS